MELVSQGIDDDYIIESFNLTEKEFLNFVPSDQELREYKPVFQRKELSDEEKLYLTIHIERVIYKSRD